MIPRSTNNVATYNVATILPLLAALGLQPACGSDSGGKPSTGGAPGTGGALGGGSGGTPGGQDLAVASGTPRPCTAAETAVAPTDGFITSFTVPDGGTGIAGVEFLAYPIGNAAAPAYATTDGRLHIVVNTPATSEPQYLGVVVGFASGCMNATAFTGVKFSISGSFSGCTLGYYTNDDAHQDDTSGAPHASGPAGSYPPQTAIAANQVTSTQRVLKMPFSGQSGGSPSTPIDPTRLIFLAWQFDVNASAGSTPSACLADLLIDDVAFY